MLPHTKLILASVTVIAIVGAIAVGWVLATYQTSLKPTPSAPVNSTKPTVSPIPAATASKSMSSPVSTQMQTATPSPIQTSTVGPTPTAISTLVPTLAPTSTPTPTSTPGKPGSNGLELTVSLEKTVYSLGETINVTLEIANVSNQTIDFTHTGMDFDFIVYNDTNNSLYQWSLGRAFAMFIVVEPLLPGENVSETDVWPQTCNTSSSIIGTFVSPGTYFVVGESNPRYGLQTAPKQVTILGP